ncbi:hypothetical protein Bca52824_001141 [Brassica carinata]|uniref:C2H2-type domain-containing protein n=1 Tax=Brassica carinata TaxID=52824 RepID=A0A8X7WHX6_BRACI|nr:hypothetical protein Bca52824_001141 [Brassica carinata]
MEFWGVEVQAGKPFKVTPGEDKLVHISHASLGNCKGEKGEAVTLNVKVGDNKFVMGTLVSESIPQACFDVLFDKEFELSHNWGKGNVHFVDSEDEEEEEEEVEVEEVPATVTANGNAAKAVAKTNDENDSDDEDASEEEEETPKQAESRRKRAHEPAHKTPVSAKKAKTEVTPKKAGKTPTAATQSPKSASQVACGSCKKTFNSANALESHTKAKHSATAK